MCVCGRDALYDSRHAAESTDGCTWFILFYLFFDFKKEDQEELLNRERKFILNFYSPVRKKIKNESYHKSWWTYAPELRPRATS